MSAGLHLPAAARDMAEQRQAAEPRLKMLSLTPSFIGLLYIHKAKV
jgi:hypothetical protein